MNHTLQLKTILMLLLSLWLLLPLQPAEAAVRYVKTTAVGLNDCSTWANACTLQTALGKSSSGDELWVTKGTHKPTTGTDTSIAFNIPAGVALYGGFTGTETARGQRNWDTNVTVLSGDLAGDDLVDANGIVQDWQDIRGTDNSHIIVKVWSATSVVLDGFTITGGRGTDDVTTFPYGVGSGLFSYQSSFSISHVVFRGNISEPAGGAFYLWETTGSGVSISDSSVIGNAGCQGGGGYSRYGNATITNVLFQNNDATTPLGRACGTAAVSGGGLYTAGANTLSNLTFQNNTAVTSGGGLGVYDGVSLSNSSFTGNTAENGGGIDDSGGSTLSNVTFSSNSAGVRGGAIAALGENAVYSRLTITDNHSGNMGGGIYVERQNISISDSIITGNSGSQGGGIFNYNGSNLLLSNSVVSGNSATVGGGICGLFNGATLTNVTLSGNSSNQIGEGWGSSSVQWNIRNSIIWGSSASFGGSGTKNISYSIVKDGCPSGATCDHLLSSDPAFVTPISAPAPTTTGNLRLQITSPAIDAGNNLVTSPALSSLDLDGNPRRVDIPSVTDTGNGTAPIVDMGAYEYIGLADLQAVKTNSVAGAAALNTPFNWLITISNQGNISAGFQSGQVIFRDQLPASGVTYGSPVIQSSTGLSGTVTCTVDGSSNLVCTAGSNVTLAALTGQFVVRLTATPTTFGALQNPRSDGICRVDPDNHVAEVWETNNDCSDTVYAGQATVTAVMQNSSNETVTSAPLNSLVHGKVTVSSGSTTPTGNVTFAIYDNATCGGSPVLSETIVLSSGVAVASPVSAASFYYQAAYGGDSRYQAATGACTRFLGTQPGPVFTVNTVADDTGDGLCTDTHCTLREAIQAANGAVGENSILFAIGDNQTIVLTSLLPQISDTLTIDGETHSITISGNDLYRVFSIISGTQATFNHLTMVHGYDPSINCTDESCGGALQVQNSANVTMNYCTVANNSALWGAGICNRGTLVLRHSTVKENTGREGGGILNDGGTLTVQYSTLNNNTASSYGGGIVNGGTLVLDNSTLTGNAAEGTTSLDGGGALDQWGAAVLPSATISNSTIVSNKANSGSSGIWLENGTIAIRNSIIANNTGNNFTTSGGTLTSNGYNLSNSWGGVSLTTGDQTGDPLVAALADNGGSTLTCALQQQSPARDTANPSTCSGTDQRGIARPQGSACDIGAYEYVPLPIVTTSTASGISHTGAVLNGIVNANGYTTAASFSYGLDSSYAAGTITATPASATGNSDTTVSTTLSGLTCNTSYHFRVNGTNSTGTSNGEDQTFTTSPCPTTATLTVSISGTGSVTSQNQTGTNYTCSSDSCAPVTFNLGDTVSLTATGSNSSFNSWGGDYTGSSNPGSITMDANKSVTATFTVNPATVKIDGNDTPYYSINSALAAPLQDATIRATATGFTENVTMQNSHTLTLKGGYSDNSFSSQTGYSSINGSLTVSSGTLVVDRVVVGP